VTVFYGRILVLRPILNPGKEFYGKTGNHVAQPSTSATPPALDARVEFSKPQSLLDTGIRFFEKLGVGRAADSGGHSRRFPGFRSGQTEPFTAWSMMSGLTVG